MNDKCVDPKVGNLCHSYELGLLNEEEVDRFQTHILTCDHCFSELQRFKTQAQMLRTDETIGSEVADIGSNSARKSFSARLRQLMWPEVPFMFRPAVALFILALLVYPAWLGSIQFFDDNELTQLYEISLIPTRSSMAETFVVSPGQAIVLEFVCSGNNPDTPYQINIFDADGNSLKCIDDFRGFDQYETGRLLLEGDLGKPGLYRLTISDMKTDPPTEKQNYTYRIAR